MKNIIALIIAALFWPAALAEAGGSIGLAYGTGASPYKNYDDRSSFVPLINYEHQYFYVRGLSAGVKIHDEGPMEISAFVAYNPTQFKSSRSGDRRLKQLDDRRDGFMAGGSIVVTNQLGIFSASLAGDISGHSGGLAGQATYAYLVEFERFSLMPSIGLNFASDKYNDYYYGVSKSEARKSGLKTYKADAAFSPLVGLAINVPLDDAGRVNLFASGEVTFLPPAIKDSPMTGRSTSHYLATGIKYSF